MPCYQDRRRLQPFLYSPVRAGLALLLLLAGASLGQPPGRTRGEARFPPLVVPDGFHATLFAADPLVEYPSVIALGPRPRTLFVAHDYMTGLGTEIVRRDEIRLLSDTDGDGTADDSRVFAGGFNSIQGLACHAGTVYAMHAPLLTALQDTDGDGVADQRRDLLSGLGLKPEDNPTRLHCANGVAVGHDGWLYLALGDNGVDVPRPEGDRLVLHGGGILRCRPDGRDLHVFSTGLRNIYDVALDAELNVFVRDNENDGGDYMIRVCHSFHGADHGYPYLYYERPDEGLPPLADLGRGSSAGGVCYLETAFPRELQGSLIFCEWGRAVVRYERQPAGSGFAPTKEIDLAAGASTDPYGFKPTDLVVDRDGSLLVSDWCDGQRPKRGRGRIYRIEYAGAKQSRPTAATEDLSIAQAISQLDAPGHYARVAAQESLQRGGAAITEELLKTMHSQKLGPLGRMHALWILAQGQGNGACEELLRVAKSDADPRVRAQAVRAIADLADPVLVEHRLDAGRGDVQLAQRLAKLGRGQPPNVLREIVVALGRLRWANLPEWLAENLQEPDAPLAHAAQQTLRRCDNWPAVLKLGDLPDAHPLRPIALRAMANQADAVVVDGLIARLGSAAEPARRREYADLLTRVYQQPAPWKYWGYRPAPRPANSVAWERTGAIGAALERTLWDPDRDVRLHALTRMRREQVPASLPTLAAWLRDERGKEHVAEILSALKDHPERETFALCEDVVRQRDHDVQNRLAAVALLLAASEQRPGWVRTLMTEIEDGPVMGALIQDARWSPDDASTLLSKLDSSSAIVRGVTLRVLTQHHVPGTAAHVPALLDDADPEVRRAAAVAVGKLQVPECSQKLLELAGGSDMELRSICLDSLRQLGDARAMSLAAASLEQPAAQRAALDYLAQWDGAQHAAAVARLPAQVRSHEIVAAAIATLASWESKASTDSAARRRLQELIAQTQGAAGIMLSWELRPEDESRVRRVLADRESPEGRVMLHEAALAETEVVVAEPASVEFLAGTSGPLQVSLNDEVIYDSQKPAKYQADALRFTGQLQAGRNRLLVRLSNGPQPAQFHLRFRHVGDNAEHERLAQHLLTATGNGQRGGEVFRNMEKSLCLKCHRLGSDGGRIGPDLAGIGSRFSRVHLIESILQPSRAIAPSFETQVVALVDGRIVSGVRIAEDDQTLTLGDDQGRTHAIPKADIDERQTQTKSTMPDGLEKRLTDRELADLLAFLLQQKKGP